MVLIPETHVDSKQLGSILQRENDEEMMKKVSGKDGACREGVVTKTSCGFGSLLLSWTPEVTASLPSSGRRICEVLGSAFAQQQPWGETGAPAATRSPGAVPNLVRWIQLPSRD